MDKQANSLLQLTQEEMTPPFIQPVPPGIKRPRWSVMIPTYNCARFLRETLESVLSQGIDANEMQIEVIDDCSISDDPESVVREFGNGRVSFFRQPTNVGAIANFNTCIRRSFGEYVHILHGDDYVGLGFYQAIGKVADYYANQLSLLATRCFVIDDQGGIDSLSPRIKDLEVPSGDTSLFYLGNPLRSPACVVRRSFYEKNGGFISVLVHTADWEMWVRALECDQGILINQPLAYYRFFAENDTHRLSRNGDNLRDFYRFAQVLAGRHPSYPAEQVISRISGLAVDQAASLTINGDLESAYKLYQFSSWITCSWRKKAKIKYAIAKCWFALFIFRAVGRLKGGRY